MIKVTVFYPATPPAATDVVVFSVEKDVEDGVATDLRDAVSLVEQEIGFHDGIIGIDVSDDESGDICVAYDPEVAPWQDWYEDALHGIWIYYNATYGRAIEFTHETQASDEL